MSLTPAALLVTLITALPLAAAEPIALSRDEFKMYRHYQAAIADPRVQKMKPEVRVSAIARDGKYKLKDLQAVIAKGDEAGDLKASFSSGWTRVRAPTAR